MIAAVYPHLKSALGKSGINGPEYFVLLYVSEFGRELEGKTVLPLSDLISALRESGLHGSDSGVRTFIDALTERGLLLSTKIRRDDKIRLFPESRGYTTVISLADAGARTLDRVNKDFSLVFTGVTRRVPRFLMTPFLTAFARVVARLTDSITKLGT